MADALGLVAGTVPATPLKYSVSLAPGQYAQLDDVVVTQRAAWPWRHPDRELVKASKLDAT